MDDMVTLKNLDHQRNMFSVLQGFSLAVYKEWLATKAQGTTLYNLVPPATSS